MGYVTNDSLEEDKLISNVLKEYFIEEFEQSTCTSFDDRSKYISYNTYKKIQFQKVCYSVPVRTRILDLASVPMTIGTDLAREITRFEDVYVRSTIDIPSIRSVMVMLASEWYVFDDRVDYYDRMYAEYLLTVKLDGTFHRLVNDYYDRHYVHKRTGARADFVSLVADRYLHIHPYFDAIVDKMFAVMKIERVYLSHRLRTRLPVVANKARLKDPIEYRPPHGVKFISEVKEFFENELPSLISN